MMFAMATTLDLHTAQLDVETAFLYGELKEEIYMHLPEGYFHQERRLGKVCRLKRSIYGIK